MEGTGGGVRRSLAACAVFLATALVYVCLTSSRIDPLGPAKQLQEGEAVTYSSTTYSTTSSFRPKSPRSDANASTQAARARSSCRVSSNEGVWEANSTIWRAVVPATKGAQDGASTLRAFLARGSSSSSSSSSSESKPSTTFLRAANTTNTISITTTTNHTAASMSSLKHWLFIGDSTMARLHRNLPVAEPLTELKKSGQCGLMKYYGFERAKEWIMPNVSVGEGPIAYGLNNSFCTDCGGCGSTLQVVVGEDGQQIAESYEYISVEFARDREQQTAMTKTSQETLAAYLNTTYVRDLCVIGTGLHDVILNITTQQYSSNVVELLGFVKPFCKQLVWLQTTATRNDPGRPQENWKMLQLNEAVLGLCPRLGPDVLILDMWNMSMPLETHVDNVHGTPDFYRELGRMFLDAAGTPVAAREEEDVESG